MFIEFSVAGELLVNLFYSFDVESVGFGVVDDGSWVVYIDDVFGCFLNGFRGILGFVDVARGERF